MIPIGGTKADNRAAVYMVLQCTTDILLVPQVPGQSIIVKSFTIYTLSQKKKTLLETTLSRNQ
jgi:hypothetical protein